MSFIIFSSLASRFMCSFIILFLNLVHQRPDWTVGQIVSHAKCANHKVRIIALQHVQKLAPVTVNLHSDRADESLVVWIILEIVESLWVRCRLQVASKRSRLSWATGIRTLEGISATNFSSEGRGRLSHRFLSGWHLHRLTTCTHAHRSSHIMVFLVDRWLPFLDGHSCWSWNVWHRFHWGISLALFWLVVRLLAAFRESSLQAIRRSLEAVIIQVFELLVKKWDLGLSHLELLPVDQVSDGHHLLDNILLIIGIVKSNLIGVLLKKSLTEPILTFLIRIQVLNCAKNFEKIFLDINSDIRVILWCENQYVGLLLLDIIFGLVVDFNLIFIVLNLKYTFIYEVQLLQNIEQI